MDLDEILLVGGAVHFNANLDGKHHEFIMTSQAIEDLANYRGSETKPPINPLSVFEDYKDLIAIAAEKLIEAKVEDNPIYINSEIIDH